MKNTGDDKSIEIEVAYAMPQRQVVLPVVIPAGMTAREAALASGVDQHFEDVDLEQCKLGIYGRVVKDDHVMQPGDRLELYRPLLADPKEVRRQLAAEGKTMGRLRD
ncbi:MAG: RnfH family protein [Gammaproteobacteria bacterium]|nr:RnfH family protein [Gammaproteobacteria bacterium]NND61121.1 RnfH family protein [Gammaproteobacteria bacterium]